VVVTISVSGSFSKLVGFGAVEVPAHDRAGSTVLFHAP
jgi:hypothetical protein